MLSLAILASGGGSNLQAIIDAIKQKKISATIRIVIGNKDGIFALERAKKEKIKTIVISKEKFSNASDEILKIVNQEKIDLIVLVGYLSILDGEILRQYKNKIINIHPSLIPNFCGDGMYGKKVHQAVKNAKANKTGCTVHYVTEVVDGGKIILQREVNIDEKDSVDDIANKVLEQEHVAIVEAIKNIAEKTNFQQ